MSCGGSCECECGGAGKPNQSLHGLYVDVTGGPEKPRGDNTSSGDFDADRTAGIVVTPPDSSTLDYRASTRGGDVTGTVIIPTDVTDSTRSPGETTPPSHVSGGQSAPRATTPTSGSGPGESAPPKGKSVTEEAMCTCSCECVPIPLSRTTDFDWDSEGRATRPTGGGGGSGGGPGGGRGGSPTTVSGPARDGTPLGGAGGEGPREPPRLIHDVPVFAAGFVPRGGSFVNPPGAGLGSTISSSAPTVPGPATGTPPGVNGATGLGSGRGVHGG